jgi:hypothetical protein
MFGFGTTRHSRSEPTAARLARRTCVCERLETRNLLSGAGLAQLTAHPLVVGPFYPSQISHAYDFTPITLSKLGSSTPVTGDGAGQTIAIVDAYNDPYVWTDLMGFDAQWGLKNPPSFRQVSQTGGSTSSIRTDSGWAMEIALDVEWAHAMAPQANILLVEAKSALLTDLLKAVDYASAYHGVSVVSMSWGSNEFSTETTYDSHFSPVTHPGVTFVAASGDSGAPAGWPAVSPNVLAVGGTSLVLNSSGQVSSESGWSGSGGGYSLYEKQSSYQSTAVHSSVRTTPDVAYNADPNSGYYVFDSVPYYGYAGWWEVGGTSAAAPQWAALVAIANQGQTLQGVGPLNNTIGDLYKLASTSGLFHDITAGNNGYPATAGYDLVTGLGSPDAGNLVKALVGLGTNEATLSAATKSTTATTRRSPWMLGRTTVGETLAALPTDLMQATVSIQVSTAPATTAALLAGIPAAADMPSFPIAATGSGASSTAARLLFGDSASRAGAGITPDARAVPTPIQSIGAARGIPAEARSIGGGALTSPAGSVAEWAGTVTMDRQAVDACFGSGDAASIVRAAGDVAVRVADDVVDIAPQAAALAAMAFIFGRLGEVDRRRREAWGLRLEG